MTPVGSSQPSDLPAHVAVDPDAPTIPGFGLVERRVEGRPNRTHSSVLAGRKKKLPIPIRCSFPRRPWRPRSSLFQVCATRDYRAPRISASLDPQVSWRSVFGWSNEMGIHGGQCSSTNRRQLMTCGVQSAIPTGSPGFNLYHCSPVSN